MKKVNENITEFLKYYCSLDYSPEYAILICGQWGCGKTWFIKDFLKEKTSDFLYISLNGISSVLEIEEIIFQQLHPLLSSKAMKITSRVFKGLLRTAASINLDLDDDNKNDLALKISYSDNDESGRKLERINDRLIIFDDLERCNLDIIQTMGYINQFVEEFGLKVIVLANESELNTENEKFKKIKEKVIGKSFILEADIDAAMKSFLVHVKDESLKEFYKRRMPEIKELIVELDNKNLRILRHTLLDFERFMTFFPEYIWEEEEAVLGIFRCFFGLSYEIRLGNLIPDKILEEKDKYIEYAVRKTANDKIDDKYFKPILTKVFNNLHESIINLEVFQEYFSKNTLDFNLIDEIVSNSHFFYISKTNNEWLNLRYFWKLDDDKFEEYFNKYFLKLKNCEIEDRDELMQLVSIFFKLAIENVIFIKKDEIIELADAQLKKLDTLGLIKKDFDFEFPNGLEYRFSYDIKNDVEFNKLLEKAKKINDKNLIKYRKEEIDRILKDPVLNFNELIEILSSRNNHRLYFRTATLCLLKPDNFIDIFDSFENEKKWIIIGAFKYRYDNFNDETIIEEFKFLAEIKKFLETKEATIKGSISRYYYKHFIEIINEMIQKIDAIKKPVPN